MSLSLGQIQQLKDFLAIADFRRGSVILDLDGTALLELRGKHIISGSVGKGIREIQSFGRPVIVNSLRFPLAVTRSVGREWLDISGERIPCVLMNGAMLGYVERVDGDVVWKEMMSFQLSPKEIHVLYDTYNMLLNNNLRNLLLFYYPREWQRGEVIWTPHPGDIEHLRAKYVSASEVFYSSLEELEKRMIAEETCMAFSLIEHSHDELMAYQHVYPAAFHTSEGITKISGQEIMAQHLNISLVDSVGAGDTIMDNFLSRVGLAVQVIPPVANGTLPFRGLRDTVRVDTPDQLGDLMCALISFVRQSSSVSTNV